MKQPTMLRSRKVILLCGATILVMLCSCGALMTKYADSSKFDNLKADPRRPDSANNPIMVDVARQFGLMALFADVAYRRDFAENERDGAGCGYLNGKEDSSAYHVTFGMPHGEHGSGKWMRWIPKTPLNGASPCFDQHGLYYETYVHRDEHGKINEAVIAFRGTENRSGQRVADWSSNFAAAFGFEPKQYALVSEYIPIVVAGLHAQFEADGNPVIIYATGHSLGGGLAQETGYLSPDIKEVFAFDTSPVTDWTYLRMRKLVLHEYPTIHRVYHGGEALEGIRNLSTAFTKARFGRIDIGVQFDKRAKFAGHAIQIIACNFAQIVAKGSPGRDADHYYPVQYIVDHVVDIEGGSRDPNICVSKAQQPGSAP